jgi:hypothetical protein
MSSEGFTLKECLVEYLSDKIKEMPRVEAKVISLQPLRITNDDSHFFEVAGLSEAVGRQAGARGKKQESFKLILNDWNFVLKHVPNSHDTYIDIHAEDYRLESAPFSPISLDDYVNMMDDVDIK